MKTITSENYADILRASHDADRVMWSRFERDALDAMIRDYDERRQAREESDERCALATAKIRASR